MSARIEHKRVESTLPHHQHKIGQNLIVLRADKWLDYCDFVKSATSAAWREQVDQQIMLSIQPDPTFAASLKKWRERIRLEVSKYHKQHTLTYAVKGIRWDIGRVLSDTPECALAREKRHSTKTVRILFSPEVHISTHPEAQAIRGAAVAELCELLARNGVRTEIITGFETTRNDTRTHYESWITLKNVNTSLNVSLLAYQLNNKDFLYTLEKQLIYKLLKVDNISYSTGLTCPADIVIADGRHDETDKYFRSIETVTQWIEELFARFAPHLR